MNPVPQHKVVAEENLSLEVTAKSPRDPFAQEWGELSHVPRREAAFPHDVLDSNEQGAAVGSLDRFLRHEDNDTWLCIKKEEAFRGWVKPVALTDR